MPSAQLPSSNFSINQPPASPILDYQITSPSISISNLFFHLLLSPDAKCIRTKTLPFPWPPSHWMTLNSCPQLCLLPPLCRHLRRCGRVASRIGIVSLIFAISESEWYTCQCQVISLASETFVPCCPSRRCRGSERVHAPSCAKRCMIFGGLLLSSSFSSLCGLVAWFDGNCHTSGVFT